ncbi:lipid-A-disaccharide synthase [Geitlerinema sp. PCC 9228]|uniref:lipid-A-disaccharide synthase n=1 Tax=Geitlerinema sp. PCC 9228 TaxID=111611 RepID=UPI0008F9C6CE|nr:lipid-A-disaccharide synthase [Geitlerinema sp. PCC 9228]
MSQSRRQARVFIATGEVSGDLQGSMLVAALHQQARDRGWDLHIWGLGGDRMEQAGMELLGNTSGIGSVGLWESLPYVLPTLRHQRRVKNHLRQQPPDVVVLVDYLGPNLGIGQFLDRRFPHIPVVYYIAPQLWVWSPSSKPAKQLASLADEILAIFPAEAKFFRELGACVRWVGHPLLDRCDAMPSRQQARQRLGITEGQTAITLVPASRRQEIRYLLPTMFAAAQRLQAQQPQVQFWIPLSHPTYRQPIETAIEKYQLNARIASRQDAIAAADLAITKSGTVNLEIALANVPQVVIYRVSSVTAWIAKHILHFSIPYMSPTNLVEMKPIVPELLQDEATPENITQQANRILQNPARYQQILQDYAQMRQALGNPGVPQRAAKAIFHHLENIDSPNKQEAAWPRKPK